MGLYFLYSDRGVFLVIFSFSLTLLGLTLKLEEVEMFLHLSEND